MMVLLIAVIILLVAYLILKDEIRIASANVSDTSEVLPTVSSEGVVLHSTENGGWLENTNAYPIRVRHVRWVSAEITQSINRIGPGAKLSFKIYNNRQYGFYIYTIDGVLVGWIRGEPPYL